MESNLDCLFADLVKLSKMYEIEEAEADKLRVRNSDLKRDLQNERKQKEDSEKAMKVANEQLQNEKANLEKKLARYREKIEDLRRQRDQKEQKQRSFGPVSYINNIHDSMNASAHTSRHSRSSVSQKKAPSSTAQMFGRGKENSHSNGSQRRSRDRDDHSSSAAHRSRSYRS